MPTLAIEYETDEERMILEQAVTYVAEIRRVGSTAAAGTVLAACEAVAVRSGRQLIRDSLAAAVQGRADAQKKCRASATKGRGQET